MKIIGSSRIGAAIRFIITLVSSFNNDGRTVVIVLFSGKPYFITLISRVIVVSIIRSSSTYRSTCLCGQTVFFLDLCRAVHIIPAEELCIGHFIIERNGKDKFFSA